MIFVAPVLDQGNTPALNYFCVAPDLATVRIIFNVFSYYANLSSPRRRANALRVESWSRAYFPHLLNFKYKRVNKGSDRFCTVQMSFARVLSVGMYNTSIYRPLSNPFRALIYTRYPLPQVFNYTSA